MGLDILPAKLQIPLAQPKTLYRSRLATRLSEVFRRPVTLVAADAGFGKSTLVASFLIEDGRPSVWYRLDGGDSDPSVFAAHLLHGLRPFVPRQAYTAAVGGLSHVTDWNVGSHLLSVSLHRLRTDVVIVLDDYHLLDAPTLQAGMTRLIETLPARAHVALLTRSHPILPLARWRAEGRLAEIGADDLRFTAVELRELLVGLHGLPLSDASLHVIGARTEGWPAGIILALHEAIAQGPQAAAQSLGTLSGSTREIYDYLAQEAYGRQDPATRRFLLASATVSQFSVPLTATLLDAPAGEHRSILDHLERSHLFIVPLDKERRWYRYHHLFQEFLRRIGTEGDGEWIRDVHRRAAAWWEGQGDVNEAMTHLIAAGEVQRAALLLSVNGIDVVSRGHLETIRRWLAALPEHTWRAAPRLYYIQGLSQVIAGATREAVRSLEEARRLLRAAGDIEGEAMAVRWLVNAAAWEGESNVLSRLLPEITEMETRLPDSARIPHAHVHAAVGRIALWIGDLPGAEDRCRRGMEAAVSSGDAYTEIWCARSLTDLLAVTGRFREATGIYEDIIARARGQHWWHEAAHLHTELAEVLLSIGKDDEAERHLGEARLLQTTVPCLVLKAEVAHKNAVAAARQGARDRAEGLLRELLGPGEGATAYRLWRFLAMVDLSILLAQTDPTEASRLAGEAVAQEGRFGLVRQGQALLAAGLAGRSPDPCLQAAATFAETAAPHWQALSLLHAASFAPAEDLASLTERTLPVLRRLAPEGWEFLLAQASPALLAPYRDDPSVGTRIAQRLPAQQKTTRLAIRCLGPFVVIREGVQLDKAAWPRAAPRRLLQYLLLQDRPVHREEIIENLWPDVEPRHGANQLRVALTHLRRVLEPDRSARQPSHLLLGSASTLAVARDRLDVDLDRFHRALVRAASAEGPLRSQALAEAVGLYRGPLFADDPFEEWAHAQRDRLARQFVEALSLLAQTEEEEGHHEGALARWQTAIDADLYAEHAYRGVMRCSLALGRSADALRAFQTCAQSLAEIGAAPSAETLALYDLIPGPSQRSSR
jgi:ATP/maltotriose-dependent transcriptional regulator MalT/DNA-binding SARP family transcriptional activator